MRSSSKWGLCALLFAATTLNYLDRQVLSVLAPQLQVDLHLGNEQLGWLFAVFYYSYTLAQLAVGTLFDRANLRIVYGMAVVVWSVVAASAGLATGLASLLAIRILLGLAESPNWPAALRIVSRTLPERERTMGNGIFTSGTSVGALIAPGISLGIAAAFGWRWAFVALGALGLFWFVAWMWFTRRHDLAPVWRDDTGGVEAGGAAVVASPSRLSAYREVLGSRRFWAVWIVSILVNPCLYFSVNWLPTYLVQERGLGQVGQGMGLGGALTLAYAGLDLGNLACGALVLALTRAGASLRLARRATFLLATLCVGGYALVPFLRGLTAVVAMLIVVNFGIGLWISSYLTMAQEVSAKHVSTAAGLLGGSGSLVGAVAMWAVGKVTSQEARFAVPMAAVTLAIVVAALAGLLVTRGLPTRTVVVTWPRRSARGMSP